MLMLLNHVDRVDLVDRCILTANTTRLSKRYGDVIGQFASKIAETESWKFSANSASLHLCVKNLWDGNETF